MKKYSFFVAIFALIAFVSACSHLPGPSDAQASAATANDNAQQSAPFSARADTGKGLRPSAAIVPAVKVVPAGTSVAVRLQSAVSSSSARSGDSFDAVLDEPLVVNGQTIAGRGTPVTGRVVAARASGHLKTPAYLRITLASIHINGRAVPVQASSVFLQGQSHNKRNLTMIGGGAGAGALLGGIFGGGKGALIGSAVGAGAGTTGAYATGKKDVGFAAERRLMFRLTQAANIQG